MDLLTIILPVISAALVYGLTAYKQKTGIDPLADRPFLKAIFEALSKTMNPQQKLALATEMGLADHSMAMSLLQEHMTSPPPADFASYGMPGSQAAWGPPPGGYQAMQTTSTPDLVHIPVKLTIHPEFLTPRVPAPAPDDGSPGILKMPA